jgi:predicted ATP-grasp superfamily ATP-dependent carboligase
MNRPPVLLLGGADNALSIARSLGKYGVTVRVAAKNSAVVRVSRYCREFQPPINGESFDDLWHRLLQRQDLFGSIVLACSDEAISFVARYRNSYAQNFVFEENHPDIQLKLLDKQATIELAKSANIDAPEIYCSRNDIATVDFSNLRFPVLVKPIYSHVYTKLFGRKLQHIDSVEQLKAHLREVKSLGVDVMLCEFIPGPDDLLCSYYSYFDESGSPLFHYTKRVIRRYPKNFGAGCYHIANRVPEAIEHGLRFFQGIGFLGLANVEFKTDPRDGRLKLIEVNARFTAAHELLVTCGIDTARIVYNRLAGNPVRIPHKIKANKRLWYPTADFAAFKALRREKEISLRQWLLSVAHKQTLPTLKLLDPMPALAATSNFIRDSIGRRF